MKPFSASTPPAIDRQTARPSGRRVLILAPTLVLLGAALAGVWFKYGNPATDSRLPGQDAVKLSDTTRDLLRHLNSSVEIRFYSVLPPGSAPEPLQDFSRRADRLLSEFQNANESQIHVARIISTAETNADAAAVDGIHPFNLDKGDACFLGITVASGGQKESLPQIQPEWEPALEFDLARAILRVTAVSPSVVARKGTPVSPETTNEVLRLIPDLNGTSLEEGTRMLREATFEKFTATGEQMEKQLKDAQQKLSEARNGGSEAEQQAATKQLQQFQLEQAEKYRQIAVQLQAQLDVFRQLKTAK